MRKIHANWWPTNVRLQCSACFATLGEWPLAELVAFSTFACQRCGTHNTLPREVARMTANLARNPNPDNPPGRAEAFNAIVGHVVLRRAIEVAVAGFHSLTVVGREEDNWMYVREILGERAALIQRCPCGNYQRPEAACPCTLPQIEKHQASRAYIEARMADIITETYTPRAEEMWADFEPWENVLVRIRRYRRREALGAIATFDWTRKEDGGRYIVRDETYTLLNAARLRLDWGVTQLKAAQSVARTIATLDGAAAVQPHHMAEAIAFRVALKD